MTREQHLKNLRPPCRRVDVVLDTDTYNEIDDQFAVSYLIKSGDRLNIKALCAAPFHNENSSGPEDGMEKSYDELIKLLTLAGRTDLTSIVFKGSRSYLSDETTPVESDAADEIVRLARQYTPDDPLYVVAIGAITNVASAILLDRAAMENTVIVWLGGHAVHWPDSREFNMYQDVAAARVVYDSGIPYVQLPCMGVVSAFAVSGPELEHWLRGQNPLCDYLADHTIEAANSYAEGRVWSRVVWDVTAVAWLLNDNGRFMMSREIPTPIPEYDNSLSFDQSRPLMTYVWHIHRDALMQDLFEKLRG